MIRAQIQFDPSTYDALRKIAYGRRCSISSVVRELISAGLGKAGVTPSKKKKLAFIGAGASGKSDIAVEHDKYLAESD